MPRWNQEPQTWVFECKLCRARFTTRWYFWPCDPVAPIHDTFHEVTARRVYCIGSLCVGRILGRAARLRTVDERPNPWQVVLGQMGFFDHFSVSISRVSQAIAVEAWNAFDVRYGVFIQETEERRKTY